MSVTIVQIVVIGLATVFASLIIKQTKPEIAIMINIAGGIVLVFLVVNLLGDVWTNFYNIFKSTGIDSGLLLPILKIIGVGYLCEFGANICQDAGSSSIADKVLFCGKIIILLIAMPIIKSVIDVVLGLL
ncbi:MAG: stage III sporulation protein AD [Clostridia bacterium]|nr:stage III sporulation protein AD [Clostridia bacterium]